MGMYIWIEWEHNERLWPFGNLTYSYSHLPAPNGNIKWASHFIHGVIAITDLWLVKGHNCSYGESHFVQQVIEVAVDFRAWLPSKIAGKWMCWMCHPLIWMGSWILYCFAIPSGYDGIDGLFIDGLPFLKMVIFHLAMLVITRWKMVAVTTSSMEFLLGCYEDWHRLTMVHPQNRSWSKTLVHWFQRLSVDPLGVCEHCEAVTAVFFELLSSSTMLLTSTLLLLHVVSFSLLIILWFF